MSDSGNQSSYYSQSQSLDNINSILSIKNEQEMFQRISLNIPKIFHIFSSFKTKLYNSQINQNDINQISEALKFVDNLNLFMGEIDVKKFKEKMEDIDSLIRKRNYNFKDTILRQIKYTAMTIIYHRKNEYQKMYFNNHEGLSKEIENELDQVYKGNKFDFRLFKQMQNIFWVVKNVINDDKKKNELENRFQSMKIICNNIKEKKHSSHYSNQSYRSYDDYENDYSDYINYTGTYDYNDNFDSGYYNKKQLKYDDYNMNNNYDMGRGNNNYYYQRGGYRKNTFNNTFNNNNNSTRKYYNKKQEEKEIEIPSDPSYYNNRNKEEDLKEENNENINTNNNNNIPSENNNLNGGSNINIESNNINNLNENNINGAVREDTNPPVEQQRLNNENNGGNGDSSNINNINNDLNNKNDIGPITENLNLTQNNSDNYKRKPKNLYPNKMIAVEVPISQNTQENNISSSNNNGNNTNSNNLRENGEVSNNGAPTVENINNPNNNNLENNSHNNINNYEQHNGEENSNIEIRTFNVNNTFNNKGKNYYYNNNSYKQNNYNKNNYHNNYYNRYNNQNNIYINNMNKKFFNKSPYKKRDFVEIDENNNIIQNKDNDNITEANNQNQNADIVNGKENENENTNNDNAGNDTNLINENRNEPNGEVLPAQANQTNQVNQVVNNVNENETNLDLNKNEKEEKNDINSNINELNDELKVNNEKENININNINNLDDIKDDNINNNLDENNFNIDFNINGINGEDKNQENKENQGNKEEKEVINEPINNNINIINNIINENTQNTNPISQDIEPKEINNNINPIDNQIETINIQKEEEEQKNQNIENNPPDIANINNNDEFNNNNIQELNEEEHNDNQDSNENMPNEDDEDIFNEPINFTGEFNKFIIEATGHEPKGDYGIKENDLEEKEEDEKIENNNFDENDLDEAFNDDLENENLLEMNDEEQEKEIYIKELLQKLDIPKIIKDALEELEQEELEKEKASTNNNNNPPIDNNEIKENINNNIDSSTQNHGNKYIDTVKDMDKKLKDKITDKLRINFKKQEFLTPKFTFYKNEFFQQNSQMFEKNLFSLIQMYKRSTSVNNNTNLLNYIFSNYLIPREDVIYQEYLILKIIEIEKPVNIWTNMQNFEKRILLPLYQKIIENRKKNYSSLENLYISYRNAIYNSFDNPNEIIEKVQKYGSFQNTFMVDIGDTDIDICIVPKCSLSEFQIKYLERLKRGITKQNLGSVNNVITTTNYLLLKITYMYQKSKYNIDVTVHNMLPIFNTNLIRLYSLYDQRFHIMGIYLKYWAKINNIHGSVGKYLSSYALLLMMIHFLQKIVEPKILPNLQKIPINNDLTNPIYGEETYEYYFNEKLIKTNSFYEKDFKKIKEYMKYINDGKQNEETVTNLLVKFFEYYAYFFDSKQKISVHKELIESIKEKDDDIAFSMDDPFEITNNPGKSMLKSSDNYKKFIKAMKNEVNFILSGEYVRRLDKEKALKLSGVNSKNMK